MTIWYAAALLLAAIVLLVCARSVVYPPVVYCGVWGMALAAVGLSGGTFIPIEEKTPGLYLLGAAGFVLGGLLTEAVLWRRRDVAPIAIPPLPAWVLDMLVLVTAAGSVLFARRMLELVSGLTSLGLLYAIRLQALRAAEDPTLLVGAIGNVVPLAIVAALVMLREPAPSRWARSRRLFLFALGMAACVLTGARSGATVLAVAAVALLALRPTEGRGFFLAVAGVSFLAVFAGLAIFVRKGEARPDASWQENVAAVAENLRDYTLGGVIGFDYVARDPLGIPGTGGVTRTLKEIGNHLGGRYELPSLHAEYRQVADDVVGNVYTAYFPYYQDFGATGVFAIPGIMGALATALYRRAVAGHSVSIVMTAIVLACCVQSIFNEAFLTNVNFLGKALVVLTLVELLRRSRTASYRAVPARPRVE
jgi:oligosaccharide repeat unit polymerase